MPITITPPVVGQPNSTEDPKVLAALNTLAANALPAKTAAVALPFGTNFLNDPGYAAARYWKDSEDCVHLAGQVKRVASTLNFIVTTLPAGFRPVVIHFVRHNALMDGVDVRMNLLFATDGQVTLESSSGGTNLSLSLDGLSFDPTR